MKKIRILEMFAAAMVLSLPIPAWPVTMPVMNCPGGPWDYAEISSASLASIDRAITMEAWIYRLPGKPQQVVMVKGELMKDWSHCLAIDEGRLAYKTRMTDIVDPSGAIIPYYAWTHVAISVNEDLGGQTKFYVNGHLTGTALGGSITQNAYPFFVGGYWATWGLSVNLHTAPFCGKIAEARVWKTVRTASEIAANYKSAMQGNEAGLVACWFGGAGGLQDRTAYGNRLTFEHRYWHDVAPAAPSAATIQQADVPMTGGGRIVVDPVVPPITINPWIYTPSRLDYDGDGKTDLALYVPADGNWHIRNSANGSAAKINWGWRAAIPIPADYNGDGRADLAVYWPEKGRWFVQMWNWVFDFGLADMHPVPADYDGDGKADVALYWPLTGNWYIAPSSGGFYAKNWGWKEAIPVPADYDGDGRADLAVYWPAGGKWYISESSGAMRILDWGWSASVPAPADYDGDGKADIGVYWPEGGKWYLVAGSLGVKVFSWGAADQVPVVKDYDGDGKADPALFRAADASWRFMKSASGYGESTEPYGWNSAVPTAPAIKATP